MQSELKLKKKSIHDQAVILIGMKWLTYKTIK